MGLGTAPMAFCRKAIRCADVLSLAREHRETLLQISNQIADVLNSHRQPNHLLRYAHLPPQFRIDHGMRRQHRDRHQRVHSAQTGRQRKQVQRLG